MELNRNVEVIVVGSDAAGLAAAAAATTLGLQTMLVEQTDLVGGTTTYADGAIWVPQNSTSREIGMHDTCEPACRCLKPAPEQSSSNGPELSCT